VLFITFYDHLLTIREKKDSFHPFLQMSQSDLVNCFCPNFIYLEMAHKKLLREFLVYNVTIQCDRSEESGALRLTILIVVD